MVLKMQPTKGERTFSDYVEVDEGLFVGSHPESEDPFELGANVVVCLASGTSVEAVPLMERGMTAREAIDRIRERRKGSLSDEYAE